jgi:hypothetical protein
MKKIPSQLIHFSPVKRITLLTGMALLTCNAIATGSIRCDGRVIDQGMPADEVRKYCGEPAVIEDGGNTWIYDFGSGERLKVIKFVQGNVEFIDERSRD